ncbi:MAG: GNAT family N-acetyltransferase, partial [Candidatus Electrothrix sp. AR3]|nr:GNAT family N-acetyltransferase [Candidatus Electrothrix sp. AR3]
RVRKWFFNSNIITFKNHELWFERYAKKNEFVFIIEYYGNPVGQVSLYNIDKSLKKAEYGRLIIGEPHALKKGIARKATSLLLDKAFNEWRILEVYLEVFLSNTDAIAVYCECGFKGLEPKGNIMKMSCDSVDWFDNYFIKKE